MWFCAIVVLLLRRALALAEEEHLGGALGFSHFSALLGEQEESVGPLSVEGLSTPADRVLGAALAIGELFYNQCNPGGSALTLRNTEWKLVWDYLPEEIDPSALRGELSKRHAKMVEHAQGPGESDILNRLVLRWQGVDGLDELTAEERSALALGMFLDREIRHLESFLEWWPDRERHFRERYGQEEELLEREEEKTKIGKASSLTELWARTEEILQRDNEWGGDRRTSGYAPTESPRKQIGPVVDAEVWAWFVEKGRPASGRLNALLTALKEAEESSSPPDDPSTGPD